MSRARHGMTSAQRRFVLPAGVAGIGIAITLGLALTGVSLMYGVDKDAYIALIALGLLFTWPLIPIINDLGLIVHERTMARRKSA